MGAHIIEGRFQSDKYPSTPRGCVPLKTSDKDAQPLLWDYAMLHRNIDAEFSDDLMTALKADGFDPRVQLSPLGALRRIHELLRDRQTAAMVWPRMLMSIGNIVEQALPDKAYQLQSQSHAGRSEHNDLVDDMELPKERPR